MMSWLRALANRDEDPGALGRHGALLASLILLLVALPLGQMVSGATPRFTILLGFVLIAAVLVNSRQRFIFVLASVIGASSIGTTIAAEVLGETALYIGAHSLSLSLLGMTTLVMLNSLIQSDDVSTDTVVGGICVYLLVGLCFAMAYILLTEIQPGTLVMGSEPVVRSATDPSLHSTRILYFSFVTLTTLGYGDITPKGEMAQMFAVAEAVIGQLYLTIFVARLVALYVGTTARAKLSDAVESMDPD